VIILAWLFLIIDMLTILLLIIVSLRGNQDPAGKAMLVLPLLVMAGVAVGAWMLLRHQYVSWAVVVAGIPAVVTLYLLYLSLPRKKE
jgi:hypothetical protein